MAPLAKWMCRQVTLALPPIHHGPIMKNMIIILAVLLLGGVAAYFFFMKSPEDQPELTVPEIITPADSPPAEIIEKPATENVLPAELPTDPQLTEDQVSDEPALTLGESDPVALQSMSALVGEAEVMQNVVTENVISKMVATMDALTSRQLSPNHLPVTPPGGELEVTEDTSSLQPRRSAEGDTIREYILDPINERRYSHYVEVLESINTQDLIAQLQKHQHLFQDAFQDLGYPDASFGTRLQEVIDHLLQTPIPDEPVRLIKPEAYYLFADPELEALSAGQKLMIRMGQSNAERVRAKLVDIKTALEQAGLD